MRNTFATDFGFEPDFSFHFSNTFIAKGVILKCKKMDVFWHFHFYEYDILRDTIPLHRVST